jgi:hypothetical protein
MLKNYRNFFFHSKITDSLKRATFIESGFLYTCNMEKDSSSLFPWQKHYLCKKDVLEFKRIVDSIVKDILEIMQEQYIKLVDKYVMNSLELPLWHDANGEIKFGSLNKNK